MSNCKGKAVIGIVRYKGKILVGKKKKDSPKFLAGEWHLPGEKLEGNETYKRALKRGIKEETGLEIIIGRYIGSHFTPGSKSKARWYECFSLGGDIIIGSDLEDAKFVLREDVLKICSKRACSLWPNEVIGFFPDN